MKKIVCFIVFLIGIIFLAIIFTRKDAILLNLNWNISIPSSYTVIYQKQTEAGFLGDGIRYQVFQYKSSPQIRNIKDWKDGFEENEEKQLKTLLRKYEIEKIYWPDFGTGRSYSLLQKDGSRLYMFFDSMKNCIYILEDIM